MTSAEAVRQLRDHLEMTQVAFAAKLGISHPTVQRYESEGPTRDACGQLVELAEESGCGGAADVLRNAFSEILRNDYPWFFGPDLVGPHDAREKRFIGYVLRMLRENPPGELAAYVLHGIERWAGRPRREATQVKSIRPGPEDPESSPERR